MEDNNSKFSQMMKRMEACWEWLLLTLDIEGKRVKSEFFEEIEKSENYGRRKMGSMSQWNLEQERTADKTVNQFLQGTLKTKDSKGTELEVGVKPERLGRALTSGTPLLVACSEQR